ncbi:hypothetical protein FisN_12Hh200 [Fistulifera solaris]|uniref:Uncharacterized protein n=1 Tax=Fistulifera solaris TaxID=1519565 RepID=A0A1Z5KBK6_FISSO|nr:hypothetical protein FisN_12Hh200 [Fistulifera solaris]|eukprot:GAX23627.1 hypothetical protein FisN_12Hh200 [Fistulifera solaris]
MLNPQLQFHLDNFSSADDEEHDEIGKNDTPDFTTVEESDVKPFKVLHFGEICHGCATGIIAFGAGLLAQPTTLRFNVLLIGSCSAITMIAMAAIQVIHKRMTARQQTMYQETRNDTSRILCSIGAPPLEVDRRLFRIIPSCQSLHRLTLLTCQIAEWIHTVDRLLRFLQASTSIQLGLGSSSRSVSRLELAFLRKQSLSHTSLFALRTRLQEKMMEINSLLLELCEQDVNEIDQTSVVTLVALKRLRQESASLVTRMLNHFFASSQIESTFERIESLCLVLSEANAYFSAIVDPEDAISPDGDDSQVLRHIQSMLLDVSGLQTCLQASYETVSSGSEPRDWQLFWDETTALVEKIQIGVNTFPIDGAAIRDGSSDLNPSHPFNERGDSNIRNTKDQQEVFTVDGSNPSTTEREHKGDATNTNKILIFSGLGDVKVKPQKPSMAPRLDADSRDDRCRYQDYENKLLAELQKHLNALPKQIEENVCMESLDGFSEDGENAKPLVKVSTEKNETACDIFAKRARSRDFLAELMKHFPGRSSSDDLDEFVADFREHCFT